MPILKLRAMVNRSQDIFQSRHSRVSSIQAYSREAAKPGTTKGNKSVTMYV